MSADEVTVLLVALFVSFCLTLNLVIIYENDAVIKVTFSPIKLQTQIMKGWDILMLNVGSL